MMGLKVTIVVICLCVFIAYQLVDRFDPEKVRGKNVIITGVSTGIGEHMAYHYARLGANIVITARREQRLQQVIEKCRELGNEEGKYYHISLDMSDKEAPLKLVKYAEKVLGGVDIVVLNHVLPYNFGNWLGSPENITELERTFTVNFNAYVNIASQAMRHLELSRGSIIVVSSLCGRLPFPRLASYTATKHALQVSRLDTLKIKNHHIGPLIFKRFRNVCVKCKNFIKFSCNRPFLSQSPPLVVPLPLLNMK